MNGIVYDSRSGNTKKLADALHDAMPDARFGRPGEVDLSGCDTVYLGFWTDKGACSEALRAVLPALTGKRVFLFGTAGFGISQPYFEQILGRVEALLPPDCTVIGRFMCAGQMGGGNRAPYEAMAANPETRERGEQFLAAFDGSFEIDSDAGAGTRVRVELPCG